MKIIVSNKYPPSPATRETCIECGTVIEFEEGEVPFMETNHDNRGLLYSTHCPSCGEEMRLFLPNPYYEDYKRRVLSIHPGLIMGEAFPDE